MKSKPHSFSRYSRRCVKCGTLNTDENRRGECSAKREDDEGTATTIVQGSGPRRPGGGLGARNDVHHVPDELQEVGTGISGRWRKAWSV